MSANSTRATGHSRQIDLEDAPRQTVLNCFEWEGRLIASFSYILYEAGRLSVEGNPIDIVYNRVTDFAFEQPEHRALRDAYRDGAVVVTPNPFSHALLADKRNRSVPSDSAMLEGWGLEPILLAQLKSVARNVLVTPEAANWSCRGLVPLL